MEQSANPAVRVESRTSHSYNFDEQSKRIYLVAASCSAERQCFSCAVHKFAYLLTYVEHHTSLTGTKLILFVANEQLKLTSAQRPKRDHYQQTRRCNYKKQTVREPTHFSIASCMFCAMTVSSTCSHSSPGPVMADRPSSRKKNS